MSITDENIPKGFDHYRNLETLKIPSADLPEPAIAARNPFGKNFYGIVLDQDEIDFLDVTLFEVRNLLVNALETNSLDYALTKRIMNKISLVRGNR